MSVGSVVYGQFKRPSGFLGAVVGWIMAHRPSNRERNRWAVSLLELQAGDRVLEIGCGPGLALELAARESLEDRVVGLDHSPLMIEVARRRNARAGAAGRVQLHCGGLDLLPQLPGPFSKVFAVNVVQFFPDLADALQTIGQVMAPGGLLAFVYQPRHRGATAADAEAFGARLAAAMMEAGFVDVQIRRLPLNPIPAVGVLGRRSVQAL